jgi:drug/metabolite transporter (DMT)-like permease
MPLALRNRPPRDALRSSGPRLSAALVFGGGLGPALLVAGLARTDAASASILLNVELAATVAIAAAFFGEHIGDRVAAGAVLVVAGGTLLVWEPGAGTSAGAFLIVAACVCWAIDNCVTAAIDQISPEQVVLAKGLVAGAVNLCLGLALTDAGVDLHQVAGALAIGAVGYGVSITLWVKGARHLGAARGQVIFATAPFIGAAVAWAWLNEPVKLVQIIASLLAAAGVALTLRSDHEHDHRHEPTTHDHEHQHPGDDHHRHRHADGFRGRHTHPHQHDALVHAHPHVPDLHHRHQHDDERPDEL